MNKIKSISYGFLGTSVLLLSSCGNGDNATPSLEIPSKYISANYGTNVVAENTVITELSTMASAAKDAEANAQSTTVATIDYPSNLSAVTLPSYGILVEGWLAELVKSANDDDGFQNPSTGFPAAGEEGGLLGTRLLDENGLELGQMVQKGSFGAALYNHALTVIDGDLSNSSVVDKLVEIHGTDPAFDPAETTAAATYSRRRSNQATETGPFYDIRNSLIAAKVAIEAGSAFDTERDQALADYLLAWEKSNFATVIYYCSVAKAQLQNATDDVAMGNALHAYAEGVAFAAGWRGISGKQITDAQINGILELLLASSGEPPESYRFLNDATLLTNFDDIMDSIQGIYEFTDEEITSFFVNDPT